MSSYLSSFRYIIIIYIIYKWAIDIVERLGMSNHVKPTCGGLEGLEFQ